MDIKILMIILAVVEFAVFLWVCCLASVIYDLKNKIRYLESDIKNLNKYSVGCNYYDAREILRSLILELGYEITADSLKFTKIE